MKALRNAFKTIVNDELHQLGYLEEELSFSAGVCIAHYKEPLGMVLSKAAAAQKSAKSDKKGDRNAFCIVATKVCQTCHNLVRRRAYRCLNADSWVENSAVECVNCASDNWIWFIDKRLTFRHLRIQSQTR